MSFNIETFSGGGRPFVKNTDTSLLELTNGKLFHVLDEQVPNNILELLTNKIDYLNDNVPPDAFFDSIPGIIVSYNPKQPAMYRRWNLQQAPDYTQWVDPEFQILNDYLLQFASNIFDFRCVISSPYSEVPWHARHFTPRIHFPLQAENVYFDFMDENEKVTTVKLLPGKLYSLNVCYTHRIRNTGSMIRKQAFFECDRVLC